MTLPPKLPEFGDKVSLVSQAVPVPLTESDPELLGDTSVKVKPDMPWSVIVWNDPINLMDFVSYVFRKVFGYSKSKANKLMMDVHDKGRANVFNGDRPEAEKYMHQLHGYGLWATLEQDK